MIIYKLLKILWQQKKQCTCPTCELLISDTVANCNSCKKWFHASCENATDEDLKKNGFVTSVKIKCLMFSVHVYE
jgi:hypothetical protein